MKKIISMLLALALLLGCGAALAEAAEKTQMGTLEMKGAFTLKCAIPENYKLMVIEETPEKMFAQLVPEDQKKPCVTISIAYNDEYSDVERMNDLPEEQLKRIEASFMQMDDVKFEYRETGLGTKILVVTEDDSDEDGDTDFVDIYSIYKGFETEFKMIPGKDPAAEDDDVDMTEDQIKMLVDFITGIDFVDAAK